MRRIAITFALFMGLALFGSALPQGAYAAPAAKSAFTTYSLADIKKLVAENKGKVVVINFFASWCPPCKYEIPALIRIRKAISKDTMLLLGLSIDEDENKMRTYLAEAKLNYPVGKPGMDLLFWAGVRQIPHLLIFNPKGEPVVNQAGLVAEEDLRAYIQGIQE